MRGFLRRDWALIRVNLWFYLLFLAGACLLAVFTDFSISICLILFSVINVMNLFAYDEANQWMGYAAAAPKGRRAMVDARYLLSLCVGGAMAILQVIVGWLSAPALLQAAAGWLSVLQGLVFGGIYLLYTAVVLPVFYRFGSTKGRMVLILVIAALSGVAVAAASALEDQGVRVYGGLFLLILLLGAAAMLVSWPISRAIVGRKEF